jgi:two-component system, NarL family, nitrate/nitrite response regulator NarL
MKVFLLDDHQIFLDSMVMLLAVVDDVELVGVSASGEEMLKHIVSSEADILICDYYMPEMDGVSVVFKLREVAPEVKVLMLTSSQNPDSIKKALQAGVKGFITKNVGKKELKTALQTIYDGFTYYSQATLQVLLNEVSEVNKLEATQNHTLTTREIDIIKLIASDMTGASVAEKLNLSTHTIATHRKNIFQKLGINSTAALVKYAIEHRLI